MRAFSKRILLAVLLGVALLGLSGRVFAQPDQQQEFPEVTTAKREQRERDEKRLKQSCGKKLKNYQLRDGEFQGAKNRGQTPDVLLKRQKARDQALQELCRCLQQFYGAYGNLPADYQEFVRLCFPPVGDPAVPGPGVDPGATPPEPPPAPPPSPQDKPCKAAWDEYRTAADQWGGDSATISRLFTPHRELCRCLKEHYPNLPPEWVRFCEKPNYSRGGTPELPIYVFPAEPRTPIMLPGQDGETPDRGDRNRTDAQPQPRSPRSGGPGSEPRSLAPGDCDAQRGAYGRLLADYKKATGAERQSLRPALENAYRELCECLRITAPAQYERFCRWQGQTEPPDMPADWPPVSIAPPPPPAAPQSTCRPEGRRVFQWVVVSDPQDSARFITEVPNPLTVDFRRESAPGEAPDVRYGVIIPGQPPITGMLNVSGCTFKASWQGPAARRQNRPYDLTLNWPGGTDGAVQGELTVEPRDNVPRDIVRYGLTASPGP